MDSQFFFTAELPSNTPRARKSFITVILLIVLCGLGICIGKYFWHDYTYYLYTREGNLPVISGWPVVLYSWSCIFGVCLSLILPFMYFMQDWKKPALALNATELFINQQMIKNTFVPYTNIQEVRPSLDGYLIKFKEVEPIISQQFFMFKPLLKSNLASRQLYVNKLYTAGDLPSFMQQLSSKIKSE